MFPDFTFEKSKRIICAILIVYLVIVELYSAGISVNGYEESVRNDFSQNRIPVSCSIEQASGLVSHVAAVKESSFCARVDSNIRLSKKRSNDYEKSIRIYLLGILLIAFIYSMTLMLSRFAGSVSLAKQRLSVIIYIHNKDGRKSHFLSCVQ